MIENEQRFEEAAIWMTKDFELQQEKIQAEIDMVFFYYMNKEALAKNKARRSKRKFAIIKIGNSNRLCYMDTEDTNIAYKVENYKCTEMRWLKFEFVRWANYMDI